MDSEYKLSHKTKKRIKEVKRKARPGKYIFNLFTLVTLDFDYI